MTVVPWDDLGMPPQKVQIAIGLGFAVLLALLDWAINDSFRMAIVVAVGAVVGLVLRFVLNARRGSDRS
jgi:hypothetical protein